MKQLLSTTEGKLFLTLLFFILFPMLTPYTPHRACHYVVSLTNKGDAFAQHFCSSTYILYFYVVYIGIATTIIHFTAQGPAPSFITETAKNEVQKDLKDRVYYGYSCVVTGCSIGTIGFYTAKYLAAVGFRVVMLGRDKTRTEEARKKLLADDPDADMRTVLGDMADLGSLEKVAKNLIKEASTKNCKFSLLVNNAGLFCPTKVMDKKSGLDLALLTNYVAPYLLTEHLIDELLLVDSKKKEDKEKEAVYPVPRIVNVSSVAHFWMKVPSTTTSKSDSTCVKILENQADINCYGISKLCQILHAKTLAKRFSVGGDDEKKAKLLTCSLHPGAVHSTIWRWVPGWLKPVVDAVMAVFFKTSEQGAMTSLYACLADPKAAFKSGMYLTDCAPLMPGTLARSEKEADAVEKWTREYLEKGNSSSTSNNNNNNKSKRR